MIIGFSFTKMLVERKEGAGGKISVNNSVAIKNAEKVPLVFGKKQENALKLSFEFVARYEPKLGEVFFEGYLIWMDSPEMMDNTVKRWQKEKKLDRALMNNVLNHILSKCNVEATVLSKEMNLPPPVPMPRIDFTEEGTAATTQKKK